ncbi:MAG: PAS domain-containing protein [Candidatus Kuenenia sp.]|nr:PAS domain-containing protein [Candidatus Kuenenia sp.]
MRNNLLRAVIEGITDSVFVKDLEGRIILANSAVYTLLEKPLNEILGRKNDEIFSADIAEKINTEDNLVLHSGKMQRFEREIPVNGGKTKLVLSTKSPYRDSNGNSIGLVVISKDITGLKKSG